MIAFAGFIDLEFSLKNVSNDFENIEPALSLVDQ
jgi:hypothetical protein